MTDNPYYGGGGFMASPSDGMNGTPGGVKRAAAHSLRPVVIKQLQEATQANADAEWLIDGLEVGQITLVAQILHINHQTTNRQYLLDDGTGRIEARRWVDPSSESDDNDLQEDDLVRVLGNLKVYSNKRYITATRLRKADMYEQTFSILDAMTVTHSLERGPPPRPGEQAAPVTSRAAHPSTTSAYTAQSGQMTANDQFSHLSPIERKIVDFILSCPASEDGVHVAAIARAIGGDAGSISNALDKLMDDGHVYTTIDESHFMVSV